MAGPRGRAAQRLPVASEEPNTRPVTTPTPAIDVRMHEVIEGLIDDEDGATPQREAGAAPAIRQLSAGVGEAENEEEEERELQELEAEVRRKERQHRIRVLRARLQEPSSEASSQASSSRRRHQSTSAERSRSPKSRVRAKDPPTYSGKDTRELDDFDLGWKAYMFAIDLSEKRAIRLATSYLRDRALRAWNTHLQQDSPVPERWEDLIRFLRDMVVDPANRIATASLRLKGMSQSAGQSVTDFANAIEQVERDLPETMDESQRRAWALLTGLRPEIRSELLRPGTKILNREQVLSDARAVEQSLRQSRVGASDTLAHRPPRQASNKKYKDNRDEKREQYPQQEKSNSSTFVKGSFNKQGCWNCGKLGHLSKDCRSPRTNENQSKN